MARFASTLRSSPSRADGVLVPANPPACSSEYSDSDEDSEGPRRRKGAGRGGGRTSGAANHHQAQRPSGNQGSYGGVSASVASCAAVFAWLATL